MNFLKKYKNIIIIVIVVVLIFLIFILKNVNSKKDSIDDIKDMEVYEYTLYNFTLDGCVACANMEEVYNEVKMKYGDKINFKEIDVDNDYSITSKYNVNLVPTYIIVDREGNVIKRNIGIIPLEDFENMIESVINK